MDPADPKDDDSFIILSSSPAASVVLEHDGLPNGSPHKLDAMQKLKIDEIVDKIFAETDEALEFNKMLNEHPSESSLMAASTIISQKSDPEALQKELGTLIDQNTNLKDTLCQTNECLHDQYLLLTNYQKEMLETQKFNMEKFVESKQLVEKLRHENRTLKEEMIKLLDNSPKPDSSMINGDESCKEVVENSGIDSLNKYGESSKEVVEDSGIDSLNKSTTGESSKELVDNSGIDSLNKSTNGKSSKELVENSGIDSLNKSTYGESSKELVENSGIDSLNKYGESSKEEVENSKIDSLNKSTNGEYNKEGVENNGIDSLNKSTNEGMVEYMTRLEEYTESTSGSQSLAVSMMEFVTSPDDDVVNKLTAQLELVEKQRRQVIEDNERLTWQKESLERVVDATTKDLDELREKLVNNQYNHSMKEKEYILKINRLTYDLKKYEAAMSNDTIENKELFQLLTPNELAIHKLEGKVWALQKELKTARLEALDADKIKKESDVVRDVSIESSKLHRGQLQELNDRLKEVQTVIFQPVRCSLIQEPETTNTEYGTLISNVNLYDRTIKHLSELLNSITNSATDNVTQALACALSLQDYKLEPQSMETFKSGLNELKGQLDDQHKNSLNYVAQIKGTLSIFEGIFKEFLELSKKSAIKPTTPIQTQDNSSVNTLTSALLARAEELKAAQSEIAELRRTLFAMRTENDERDLLRAQIDIYKCDFLAEREAREKLACEKETAAAELRGALKKNQELLEQLEEVRKLNPNIYKSATTKRMKPQTFTGASPSSNQSLDSGTCAGNMVYTCPKCNIFSSDQYKVMEDHFDYCLDNILNVS